ncbi:MAG: RdgB/HAM1 family non-canonical purine NTP pyrophosphatase [Clostridiaceae bacterium]|jgi:XTP/dITP diphosphohydrolase|nr:RdgB/HAM1 family non-canonical purine NTP pyrophosphatase [Bacillota bacterium]NLN51996.1 RdgB/HAM1 family non-canonical purine NTP pyrophosphatase [Clostridiaceae bacterium]
MEIILATHNPDKVKEFSAMLEVPKVRLVSMQEHGLNQEAEETGKTYAENAYLKARFAHQNLGGLILADDSGLSIDVLDGYPGIYSSRFAGLDSSYEHKIEHIWSLLSDYPQDEWTAAFHCALVFIDLQGREYLFEGECRGIIIPEMRGNNGFGYDPIFYKPEYKLTTGEMKPELKNKISHRALAFAKFSDFLQRNFIQFI